MAKIERSVNTVHLCGWQSFYCHIKSHLLRIPVFGLSEVKFKWQWLSFLRSSWLKGVWLIICERQFAFMCLFPYWHHFLLLSISQRWPWDLATCTQPCTGKLYILLSACGGHIQREASGLTYATLGFHVPPAPTYTLSALYRKFTTLWPHIKVPFWINTKVIKGSRVVGLKYQSCFIAGI